ncbi:hypothetical protein BURC_02926 [Burkholderiaceae bacterium]|nr:hypothetical protein BURC_02926 [Burkholderiaceae bacterium]
MKIASLRRLALAAAVIPLLAGCLEKDRIASIADAENQLMTPDGRLIVSGGTGVFEIKTAASGFIAQPATSEAGRCNHTGLAQIGAWVFTACQQRPWGLLGPPDNHLLAARLVAGQPLHFVQVERASPDPMERLALPNGLAVAPNGRLLIADYNLFMLAGVARVGLDLSGARPRITSFEPNWVGSAHGIAHPNGVRVTGNELFVSDFSFVKRYQFDAAGNVPVQLPLGGGRFVKNEVLVYQGLTVLDDIQPHCGGLIITDFAGGRLIYMAPDGDDANGMPTYRLALHSGLQSLQQPSSVLVGRGPLFGGRDVLVTEKGLLNEFSSDYGNKLSRVKSEVDLNDPSGCARVNGG